MEENHYQDVRKISLMCQKYRRTALFSATLNCKNLQDLVKFGLRNPVFVQINEKISNLKEHIVILESRTHKLFYLYRQLKNGQKCLVFFNTCDEVNYYSDLFIDLGLKVLKIHRKMQQGERERVYNAFINQDGILFSTDLSSRGLDITDILEVF